MENGRLSKILRTSLALFFFLQYFALTDTLITQIAPYKVLSLVPFGDNHLKIVFNQDTQNLKLKESKLKDGRVFIDIEAILVVPKRSFVFRNNSIINVAQNTKEILRLVIKPNEKYTYTMQKQEQNLYIRQELADSKPAKPAKPNPPTTQSEKPKQESKPTPPPKQNSIKKKIALDPGHGGKDCGAMGANKVCEKTIVLEVAKILNAELKKRGYIVYMTRNNDTFIDLIDRTKFANDKGADLFISIHANSIPVGRKSPSGIETYFLSTNRSEKALKVAEAENIGDIATMNHFSKQTFLNTINNHRLIASSKLAIDIQAGMRESVRRKYKNVVDGGVRDGPFWVLAGALMPSVLIEIGYVSHNTEGKLLTTKEYQKLLAEGIADGIDDYLDKN
ncbi:N-acetylmuramoyl-L-alanine amidase family protein [Helicobacter himalayensis]|uniref:N-acetylmuramoyl-L-alanine amidase family protein n=1 Tax=Helicobacter himalayensis TaxID=1591088 RepID=UPI003D6DCBE8